MNTPELAVEMESLMLACQTGVAHLLGLLQHWHVADDLFSSHLPQCPAVGMPKPSVPEPSFLPGVCRPAHWLCNIDVKDVEVAGVARHIGQQVLLLVTDPHHALLHEHLKSRLIELDNTDNIGGEARDVVGVGEDLMFPILACEEYCVTALDGDDGAIAKAHGPHNTGVEVGEGTAGSDS